MGALLSAFATWLFNTLLFIPRKIFELAMEGIAAAFNAIPAPGFLTGISGAFGALGNDVLWWITLGFYPVFTDRWLRARNC
jgi:hypothetical protein